MCYFEPDGAVIRTAAGPEGGGRSTDREEEDLQ